MDSTTPRVAMILATIMVFIDTANMTSNTLGAEMQQCSLDEKYLLALSKARNAPSFLNILKAGTRCSLVSVQARKFVPEQNEDAILEFLLFRIVVQLMVTSEDYYDMFNSLKLDVDRNTDLNALTLYYNANNDDLFSIPSKVVGGLKFTSGSIIGMGCRRSGIYEALDYSTQDDRSNPEDGSSHLVLQSTAPTAYVSAFGFHIAIPSYFTGDPLKDAIVDLIPDIFTCS